MTTPVAAIPVTVVNLDADGRLISPWNGLPVASDLIADHLASYLNVPEYATDIYVYVHGWRTTHEAATAQAQWLLTMAVRQHEAQRGNYRALDESGYRPWVVAVCWPSHSSRSPWGYRKIRDRAHEMGVQGKGEAALVLAHLLGYLDEKRAPFGPPVIGTLTGQFLHLCGHSFGGRFLCEAVQWAAHSSRGPGLLGWSYDVNPQQPFTVDSLLVFQMAAPRDAFAEVFPALFPVEGRNGRAPLAGPIVLTHSRYDRANGIWHRRAEGSLGIGHSGARRAPAYVHNVPMLALDRSYTMADLDHRIVNVDASWRFKKGNLFSGAHSDIAHPESVHLLLSLAALSRGD